jgi:hypothetical protein
MKTLAAREEKLIEQMSLLDSIGKLISAPA